MTEVLSTIIGSWASVAKAAQARRDLIQARNRTSSRAETHCIDELSPYARLDTMTPPLSTISIAA